MKNKLKIAAISITTIAVSIYSFYLIKNGYTL